jgi:hypothetical protein
MKNIFLLLAFLALLSACAHIKDTPSYRHTAESFQITSIQSFFVNSPSVEVFNTAVKMALAGDDNQLAYILSLARFTDGEGSISYGSYLTDLEAFIGSKRFNHSLKALPQQQQLKVKSDVNSAREMRRFAQEHT